MIINSSKVQVNRLRLIGISTKIKLILGDQKLQVFIFLYFIYTNGNIFKQTIEF
jgi:hypothetical protein